MAGATSRNGGEGNVVTISSQQDWDSKLLHASSNGTIVVVQFIATWCEPCKTIAPLFAELSNNFTDLLFLKVDVDKLDDLGSQMDILAMPTFVFLKDGKPIDRLVGAKKADLQKKISKFSYIGK